MVAEGPQAPWESLDLLDDDDRRELEERAGRRRFKPGQSLTHQGGPGAEVLVLLSGRVKVSIDTADGREVVLTFAGPGHLIGEFAVIDSEARSGTTEALEPVEALALSSRRLPRPARAAARDRDGTLRNLVRRFRDADRIRIEFASAQTLGRVAARLLRSPSATASRPATGSQSPCRSPRRSSPAGRAPRARRPRRLCSSCASSSW